MKTFIYKTIYFLYLNTFFRNFFSFLFISKINRFLINQKQMHFKQMSNKNVFNTILQNNNTIFLYDDFNQQIGVLNNEYYYGYPLKNSQKSLLVSVQNNDKVKNDSMQHTMNILTKTFTINLVVQK